MNIKDYEKAKKSLIRFYTKIKVRKEDDVRDVSKEQLGKEEENLNSLPLTTLIEYVKSGIDIFVEMKLEEELMKHKTPLMEDEQNEAKYYETLLRKEECANRQHISVEHLLRGDLDKAKDHIEELTIEVSHLRHKLKKVKMINDTNSNYLMSISPEEVTSLKEKVIRYEEQYKESVMKEGLLKKQLLEKSQEIKLLESKMSNRNNSSFLIGIDKDAHNANTIEKDKKDRDKERDKDKLTNVSSSSSLTTLKKPKKLKIKEDPQMKKLQMYQKIQLKGNNSINSTLNHNSIINSNHNIKNDTNVNKKSTNNSNVNYNYIKNILHSNNCNSMNSINSLNSISSMNNITSCQNSPQVNYPLSEKCDYNRKSIENSPIDDYTRNKAKGSKKGCTNLSYIKVGSIDQDLSLILKRNEELTQRINGVSMKPLINNDKKSPPTFKKIGLVNSLKDICSRNKSVGKINKVNQNSIIIHQNNDLDAPMMNNFNIYATSNDMCVENKYSKPSQVNVQQNIFPKVDHKSLGKKPRNKGK